MALPPNPLKNLMINPNVKAKKDSLNSKELAIDYKELKYHKAQVKIIEDSIKQKHMQDAHANGLEPAYLNTTDLVEIISTVLNTKCPISKAFEAREKNAKLCKEWAKRTIKRKPDRLDINDAFNDLELNEQNIINLIKKYNQFDINQIIKANTYSEGLNQMKKQLIIARELEKKDIKIENLEAQIKILSGDSWEVKALSLRKLGMSFNAIAKLLGKYRTTIAKYLNQPNIKAQW